MRAGPCRLPDALHAQDGVAVLHDNPLAVRNGAQPAAVRLLDPCPPLVGVELVTAEVVGEDLTPATHSGRLRRELTSTARLLCHGPHGGARGQYVGRERGLVPTGAILVPARNRHPPTAPSHLDAHLGSGLLRAEPGLGDDCVRRGARSPHRGLDDVQFGGRCDAVDRDRTRAPERAITVVGGGEYHPERLRGTKGRHCEGEPPRLGGTGLRHVLPRPAFASLEHHRGVGLLRRTGDVECLTDQRVTRRRACRDGDVGTMGFLARA